MAQEGTAEPGILADIGKFTALASFFCMLVLRLPELSFLTVGFCPIPITMAASRRGAKAGLAVIALLGAVLVLLNGAANALPLLFFVSLISLGYIWAISKGMSFAQLVGIGTVIAASCLVLLGLLASQGRQTNIIERQTAKVKKDFSKLRKEYIKRGFSKEQVEEQAKAVAEGLRIFPKILPAAVVVFSIWIAFISVALTGVLLKGAGENSLVFPAFKMWQFPWYFAWGYIVGLIGTFFSGYLGAYKETGMLFGMNFLAVFNMLFLVQGIEIIYFFMDKFKIRTYLRALSFGLLLVVAPALPLVIWFGLLDVWFNFRKLPAAAES